MTAFFAFLFMMFTLFILVAGAICVIIVATRLATKHPDAARTGAGMLLRLLKR